MKLKIAGGCGEHGRNCSLVENGVLTEAMKGISASAAAR